jgi:pyruvate formate lyase activating enzyme
MLSDFKRLVGRSLIADVNFPSELCSTLFLQGCNFRCPYCINRDFVIRENRVQNVEKTVQFFQLRGERKLVVSGGEPFLTEDVYGLFQHIKDSGMLVAVATNGSFPDRIKYAVRSGLISHVIMDIKTALDRTKYSDVTGTQLSEEQFSNIIESIDYLKSISGSNISVEFRTTVCSKFVTKEDVFSIAEYIGRDCVYFLQPFYSHQTISKDMTSEYSTSYETLKKWSKELSGDKVLFCAVREV